MDTKGYKCKTCGTGFEDIVPEDDKVEVKCPQCSSMLVEESEEVLKFLELIQEMGRTGG